MPRHTAAAAAAAGTHSHNRGRHIFISEALKCVRAVLRPSQSTMLLRDLLH